MIEFHYELDFKLSKEQVIKEWVASCIDKNGFKTGEINYIFCDDDYLLKLNVEFLNHDTLTDIISFDNTLGKTIGGDVFISIDRVKENAKTFAVLFDDELHRVLIHGILHYMGLNDKTEADKVFMRQKENESLLLLKH